MKARVPRYLAALWFGTALASLFFYPLLQALNGDVYLLNWEPANTAEFAIAVTGLSIACAAAWIGIGCVASERWKLTLLLLLTVVPVGAFAATVLRFLPIRDTVVFAMARAYVFEGLAACAALAVLALIVFQPRWTLFAVRGIVLILSPVTLLMVTTTTTYAGAAAHRMFVPPPPPVPSAATQSVYVFLFDELSFRFMYEDRNVRAQLPNFKAFADVSTNFLAATAPGHETITSVPGFLAARRFDDVDVGGNELYEVRRDGTRMPLDLGAPGGLFSRARASGRRTEAIGYFFPYCRLLSGIAEQCRAFSFYNYADVADGFSPVNAVITNLILLPHQRPFGWLKVPVFARLQRRIVEQTMVAALDGLESGQPRFRFVHFSLPHLPFVFHREGYGNAGDPMRQDTQNYESNLEYVDTVVGRLVAALKEAGAFDESVVVITSDHEYRGEHLDPEEGAHVPLLIKRAGQRGREIVTDPVQSERILAGLFQPAR